MVAGARAAIDLVRDGADLRARLHRNTGLFRPRMAEEGFDMLPGEHPIVAVMFPQAGAAVDVAAAVLDAGIHVVAFHYPVVPRVRARVRVHLSAAHSADDVERCVQAFTSTRAAVGRPPG